MSKLAVLFLFLFLACNNATVTKPGSSDVNTLTSPPELKISFNKQTVQSTDSVTINYSLKNISDSSITLCFDLHSNLHTLKDSQGIYQEAHPFQSHAGCLESEIVKIPSQSSLTWVSKKKFQNLPAGDYLYTARVKSFAYREGYIYSNPIKLIVSK